jgi:hypothetical protein
MIGGEEQKVSTGVALKVSLIEAPQPAQRNVQHFQHDQALSLAQLCQSGALNMGRVIAPICDARCQTSVAGYPKNPPHISGLTRLEKSHKMITNSRSHNVIDQAHPQIIE